MDKYRSWGYCPSVKQNAVRPGWRDFVLSSFDGSLLPFGSGRSYGDSCLNSTGQVIDGRSLNKFISFDIKQGVLRCEAGVTFKNILETIVPEGWFLPVTPGTKFVTVGGAIANDVHGKNHHQDGTLGRHIRCFELFRSNGDKLLCSPDSNADLFQATIGGLGLTGFISWAEIQLIPIQSPYIEVETIPFNGLNEFYELSKQAHKKFRYTVAWLDCIAEEKNFARGLFMQANHSSHKEESDKFYKRCFFSVPFNFPQWLINKYSVNIINTLYFYKHRGASKRKTRRHYDSFFYPLDNINNWNRIYGKEGFFQYQFVVPKTATHVMDELLKKIVASGLGSFLAVLKEFGDLKSPGMLSFPKPGICLAVDFSNKSAAILRLLNELDELVMNAGGAVYPAKDDRMSGRAFKTYYPESNQFVEFIDPRFTSDFWKRVNGTA